MAVKLEAFLDLENSLTARLQRPLKTQINKFSKAFHRALVEQRFDDAQSLIDGFDTSPVIEKNEEYMRTIGRASMLHGASRLTKGEPEETRLREEVPERELENAVIQLSTMIEDMPNLLQKDMLKFLSSAQASAAATGMDSVMKAVSGSDVMDQVNRQLMGDDGKFVVNNLLGIKDKYATPRARDIQFQLWTKGQRYVQTYSSLHVSRLNSFGFLAEAHSRGVSTYVVNEVLDDRICPVCELMHGREFSVDAAMSKAMHIMDTTDPDDLKTLNPWPSQSKASVAEMRAYTDAEMANMNLDMPPYHPLCRGVIDYLGTEVTTETDITRGAGGAYRKFTTDTSFQGWAAKAQGKYISGLDGPTKFSLSAYKSNQYQKINTLVRGKYPKKELRRLSSRGTLDNIVLNASRMDDAFDDVRAVIPDNVLVHRGGKRLADLNLKGLPRATAKPMGKYADIDDITPDHLQKLVGQRITDRGYSSVTASRAVADDFAYTGVMPYRMDIRLPRHSRGIWADHPALKSAMNKSERELILDRGTQFKIVSAEIRTRKGRKYVQLVAEAQQPAQRLALSDDVLRAINDAKKGTTAATNKRYNLWEMSRSQKVDADVIFRAAQKGRTYDEIYKLAPAAQKNFETIGKLVADEVGGHTKFVPPPAGFGVKKKTKSIEKLVAKYGGRTEDLTDISRGGFYVQTAKESDDLVAALMKHYDVLDEGWVTNGAGYFDRKLLLRSDNGFLTEVQMWSRGVWRAKEKKYNIFGKSGHDLYDDWIKADRAGNTALADELSGKMRELYASVTVDPSLEVFRVYGSQAEWLKAGRPELPKLRALPKRVTGSAPYRLTPMPSAETSMFIDDLMDTTWRADAYKKVAEVGARAGPKTEHGMAINAKTGQTIVERTGQRGTSSVNHTTAEITKIRESGPGTVYVHNHPSGNALSTADMKFAAAHNVDEIVAVSNIENGVSFSARPLLVLDDIEKRFKNHINSGAKKLNYSGTGITNEGAYRGAAYDQLYRAADLNTQKIFRKAIAENGLSTSYAGRAHYHLLHEALEKQGLVRLTTRGNPVEYLKARAAVERATGKKWKHIVDEVAYQAQNDFTKTRPAVTPLKASTARRYMDDAAKARVVESADDFDDLVKWGRQWDDPDITPEAIYAQFDDSVKVKMQAMGEQIASGRTTASIYKAADGTWDAARVAEVHDTIVNQILTKDVIKRATAKTPDAHRVYLPASKPIAATDDLVNTMRGSSARGSETLQYLFSKDPDAVANLMDELDLDKLTKAQITRAQTEAKRITQQRLAGLPDEFVVYRGVHPGRQVVGAFDDAVPVTTDKAVAQQFARGGGRVEAYIVRKSDVLADVTSVLGQGFDESELLIRASRLAAGAEKAAKLTETPQYITLAGRPASGKSFFARPAANGGRGLNDKGNYLLFNPDDVKELMGKWGYEGWNAAHYHEEAQVIAEKVIAVAREKRMNMIIEGTFSNGKKVIRNAEIFKDAGYEQIGMYMHLPRQETARRTVFRFLNPEEGRYVPLEVTLQNTKNEVNFKTLMDKYFSKWEIYDNQGSGAPVLLGKGELP